MILRLLFVFVLIAFCQGAYRIQISYATSQTLSSFTEINGDVPLGGLSTDAPIGVADFGDQTFLAFKQSSGSNVFIQSTSNIFSGNWTSPIYILGSLCNYAPALYSFNSRLWLSYVDVTGVVYVTSSATPTDSSSWSSPLSLTAFSNGKFYLYNAPNFESRDSNLCVMGSLKTAEGYLGYMCYNPVTTEWSSNTYYGPTSSYNQWSSAVMNGLTYKFWLGTGGSNIDYLMSDNLGDLLFPDNDLYKVVSTTSASIPVVNWQNTLVIGFRGRSSTNCYFMQSFDGQKWGETIPLTGRQCSTAPALLSQQQTLYFFSVFS